MRTRTAMRPRARGVGRPSNGFHPMLVGQPSELGLNEEMHSAEFALDLGKQLVNSGLYDWALEEIPDMGIKRVEDRHAPRLALLIHNQLRAGGAPRREVLQLTNGMVEPIYAKEDIQTGDLALPTKWSLPIIRRIYPPIFDSPFFATQPMPGPLAYAFYMDLKREADGTDFRAIAPFTAVIGVAVSAGTTVTLSESANAGVVGFGPYQVVVGQTITLSYGTANAETFTINGFAPSTGVVTLSGTITKAHAVGDFAYIAAPASLGEAAVPQKAKLSLTRTSVTAQKWTLAATWTTEAMEDARAQLNLDIEAEMVQGVATEIGRELFSTIMGDIVQGATGGAVTLPAKGGSTVSDYRYLAIQPIYQAEAKLYTKRFHLTDVILAGVDLATNLSMQDNFHTTPFAGAAAMAELGVTHLGTFQGKWQVFMTTFLPPNMAILFQKPTDWLHSGYVYMPYIPLSPMPLVYAGYSSTNGNYTNTDEWTRNIRTRAGRLLTVSDEYGILTQG